MKNKYINFTLIFISLFFVFSTTSVFAYELDWPNSPAGTSIGDGTTITTLVKYIYEWGISIGILLAFVAVVVAGFTYMTSVGNANKIKEAQDNIKDAFIGLALLLSSWLILNTINPSLTNLTMPNIDYEMDFDDWGFTQSDLPIGECERVVFWEEKNFEGKIFPVEDFVDTEEQFREKTFFVPVIDPVTGIVNYVQNKLAEFNPKSYIAYRKMRTADGATEGTEEGRKAIAGMNVDKKLCEVYQSKDSTKRYCEEGYIKDDSCMVELYAESPFWDRMSDCGDKILNISGALKNIPLSLSNPTEKIKCYKIIPGEEE